MAVLLKRSIQRMVLPSLSTLIILSSVILSVLMLGALCSQVVSNLIYAYNAMMQQESPVPSIDVLSQAL